MDEVCAKSQTRRHVARPKNGSLARCPKTKAEILNAARSEDGVCDSSHARIFPSLSPHRVAYGIVPFWSCHSPVVAAAATHGRGRYEKEWNAVVPILGCPRSLPSLPQPLLRRCYRVDLMMVLAQHHPSKATARRGGGSGYRTSIGVGVSALRSFYAEGRIHLHCGLPPSSVRRVGPGRKNSIGTAHAICAATRARCGSQVAWRSLPAERRPVKRPTAESWI